MVVVEHRIKEQEELALSLVTPHRIRGEEYDVALPDRNIHYRRSIRQLRSAGEHAAYQKILLILIESQNHARSEVGRSQVRAHEETNFIRNHLFAGLRRRSRRSRSS